MNSAVRLLFHELADLSPPERERFFRERRIGPELRAEVESLLRFDSTKVECLTDRVSNAADEVLRSIGGAELSRCGPYRLVRLLGSGGMGAVYLAQRTDGEIQQNVAVKLLRADSHRQVWRERFLRERQLLASLHHPSIVHVIDAGHTEDGRPYLVMEYVEGVPIDVYTATIDVSERLKLFLKVCEGVSHAHRCLIIHRDLKPSNILVDASGQPKLLDFGIAKMLDEAGDATQTVERLLTPNYASPEQLAGIVQSTATDVYSLGAVLYKLLTGAVPSEIHAPSHVNAGIPKDVDFIVLKALRKEPEERYVSVDELANDVRAALDSRPVQARAGNAWYHARKFLRRYWLPVAAAMLVLASLSVGLYIANHERAIAQRRFIDVRQLANKLFDIDVQVRGLSGSTKTRQLIVDTSLEYLRRLAADARGDPDLALEVGNAYMRVARVQGVPISANLGQMDQADQNLRVAEKLMQFVLASQPRNRTAMLRSAQIAHDRMLIARLSGRDDEAMALARRSAGWLEMFHAGKSDVSEATAVLSTYLNVADQHVFGRQYDDALRLSRRASEISRAFGHRSYLGTFRWVSAEVFRRQGNLDEALKEISESVRQLDFGPAHPEQPVRMNFAFALIKEGSILGEYDAVSLGRFEEAAGVLEHAFRIADDFAHRDADDQDSRGRLALAGIGLGHLLLRSDPVGSLAMYDHTLRHMAEIRANSSFRRYEASALAGSSYALRRLGRPAEAKQRLDAAFERLAQAKLYPAEKITVGLEADQTLRALADYEAGNGNLRRAIEIYQKLLDGIQAARPDPETDLTEAVRLSSIYRAAAVLHRRAGEADLADILDSRRLDLWHQWDRKLAQNVFVRRQLEAASLP
jgi:tetratricopeptide (TPR) repeat protein